MSEAATMVNRRPYRARPQIKIGETYGRLTVVGEAPPRINKAGHRVRRLECVCECGGIKDVRPAALRNGTTRSCGCLGVDLLRARSTTHGGTAGYTRAPEYERWTGMIGRCHHPVHANFPSYGGRGIFVCERWHDFAKFVEDMGSPPEPSYTLDRIDNDGPYSKENCRWASKKEQARNTRRTRRVVVLGREMALAEIAELSGLNESSIRGRIASGWPLDELVLPQLSEAERARRASIARWSKSHA